MAVQPRRAGRARKAGAVGARAQRGGSATGPGLFLASVAAMAFVVLAVRWLLELRRSALAAKLPLTALDKLIAFAPVAYTVFCFVAAGLIVDSVGTMLAQGGPTARLPIVGEVGWDAAIWFASLCAGLALFTPPVVVFTVEGYFGQRLPELVVMGRQAVWSVLTGVSAARPRAAPAGTEDEDVRWKRLLG